MLKDIPEIAERFPNLDDRLKAVTEAQKILDKGLEVPRARKAAAEAALQEEYRAGWERARLTALKKERAERLERARKRLGYNITFIEREVSSPVLNFHKGDFLYLPQQEPRVTQMTSVTIIRKTY